MADIALDVITQDDLTKWYEIKERMTRDKATEAMLRSRIFASLFKTPKEGVNTVSVKDVVPEDATGAVVKGTYVINRSIDVGTLAALRERQSAEGYNGPKLNFDELIKTKPELSLTAYNKLTEEEKKFMDEALVIKPGSPQLEITIPKRATAT